MEFANAATLASASNVDGVFKKIAAHLGPRDLVNFAMANRTNCLPVVQKGMYCDEFVPSRITSLLRAYEQLDVSDQAAVLRFARDSILEVSDLSTILLHVPFVLIFNKLG